MSYELQQRPETTINHTLTQAQIAPVVLGLQDAYGEKQIVPFLTEINSAFDNKQNHKVMVTVTGLPGSGKETVIGQAIELLTSPNTPHPTLLLTKNTNNPVDIRYLSVNQAFKEAKRQGRIHAETANLTLPSDIQEVSQLMEAAINNYFNNMQGNQLLFVENVGLTYPTYQLGTGPVINFAKQTQTDTNKEIFAIALVPNDEVLKRSTELRNGLLHAASAQEAKRMFEQKNVSFAGKLETDEELEQVRTSWGHPDAIEKHMHALEDLVTQQRAMLRKRNSKLRYFVQDSIFYKHLKNVHHQLLRRSYFSEFISWQAEEEFGIPKEHTFVATNTTITNQKIPFYRGLAQSYALLQNAS